MLITSIYIAYGLHVDAPFTFTLGTNAVLILMGGHSHQLAWVGT